MVSLLEKLEATVTPNAVTAIRSALGIDASSVQKGLKAVGPTLLGGLARTATTPEGMAYIMERLSQGASTGDVLGRALKSLGAGSSGADMLNHVLGYGCNAVSNSLSRSVGFDVAPLLRMGAPLVLGLLANIAKTRSLDASGVAEMLQQERAEFMSDPAYKGVARITQAALEAGDAAIALRKNFADDDWKKIRSAPLAATYLIITASLSKGAGAVQELGAAAGALMESINAASPTSLLGTAFGCGMTMGELDRFKKENLSREQILGIIKCAAAAVKAQSPVDARPYCDMLMNVAQKAAEAAKEGGFLGIGAKWVSESEEKTLADIKAALS